MDSKKINLSKSYLYGFFASMISALIYSAVIIPIYILLISPNPQNFFVYLLYTLDIWVWIWIAVSILYSFIIVLMFNINKDFINTICNFLFFIVTSSILLLSLSYVPAIQNILYRREYTFYFAILCFGLFFISIQLTYSLKKVILFMYKSILYNLGYDDEEEEYSEINTNVIESEIFFNTLKNIISFAQRHEYAIGLIAFKISNHKKIVDKCGEIGYKNIEEELIKFIKQTARTGENQCLAENNIIYAYIYAEEEDAWKTIRRYFKGLKNYNFEYNGENIDVEITIAVSGYDFSINKMNKISAFVVKDNLITKLQEALIEAEETENPIVFYQKGI
ncbi:hypothetical protein [uncultured Brachyspira sp.]|uniref:hypothetical protein n=1 Tax=uncultured Brachyspira sp. TaxID=221953 RepID=UPI0025896944|nr:hypothetical protein [uncultured Brachyspira sp.]